MKKNITNTKITILCDGVFPTGIKSLKEMNTGDFLLCCDGAANQAKKNGYEPDLIIGDMDSLSNPNEFKGKIKVVKDQSSNDLSKAILWAQENGYTKATILGATGNRDDHMIANVFLLLDMDILIDVKIITDFGEFAILDSRNIRIENNIYSKIFSSYPKQQISIFCADNTVTITSTGLKHKINGIKSKNLHQLSLNESISENFSIGIDSNNSKLIVYKAFKTE